MIAPLVLRRLLVNRRDIEEERKYSLLWEAGTATWRIAGDAEEYRNSKERQEIIDSLATLGEPAGPKEVSEILNKPYNNVKQLMWKMNSDGDLRSVGGGKYVPVTDSLGYRSEPSSTSGGNPSLSKRDEARRQSPPRSDGSCRQGEGDRPPKVSMVTEVTVTEGLADDGEAASQLLTTEDKLESVAEELRAAQVVGVDLETTGIDPRTDKARLISLSTTAGSWLIDCSEVDSHPLFSVLSRKTLVMHNAQFDLGFMSHVSSWFFRGCRVRTICCLRRN